jgi:hypothetical protein
MLRVSAVTGVANNVGEISRITNSNGTVILQNLRKSHLFICLFLIV